MCLTNYDSCIISSGFTPLQEVRYYCVITCCNYSLLLCSNGTMCDCVLQIWSRDEVKFIRVMETFYLELHKDTSYKYQNNSKKAVAHFRVAVMIYLTRSAFKVSLILLWIRSKSCLLSLSQVLYILFQIIFKKSLKNISIMRYFLNLERTELPLKFMTEFKGGAKQI